MVMAIPAKRRQFTVTQSDGTQLTLMLVGDENLHYYLNVNTNEKMLRGDNGDYYVMSETTYNERKQKANVRRSEANKSRIERLNARRNTSVATNGQKRVGSVGGGITGDKKGLVILVNFSDKTLASSHTQSVFNNQFNQEGYSVGGHIGSVHDYFYDQSYGKFNLTFDVVGPVTVSKTMSYYGSNDSSGSDKYPATMVIEACKLADAKGVNFADYDWDGDGYVDQVYVIYAGYGEAYGAASNTIWPHEWTLSYAKQYGDGSGVLTLDGKKIDTYACSCELSGTSGSTLNGIGTACHEFSHCLGYPDFYDTDYSGGIGMDNFDVMSGGSYNGPDGCGEVPSGYTAYERWQAGWLEPEIIDGAETITDMPALNDEGAAYIIFNEKETKEYFLLENRKANKWFKYFADAEAGHGLFITHVDEDEDAREDNTPNDDASHQRMTWVAADGNYGTYSSSDKSWLISEAEGKGDFFPGTKNVTSFNGESHKSVGGKFFNLNTNNTYYMNHALTEISESDGKISFLVDGGKVVDDGSRYTITFNAGGGTCTTSSWTQSSMGEAPTSLPTPTPPYGWTFVGWTTSKVTETTTYPTPMYYASGSIALEGDITLYAVYKQTASTSSDGNTYTLVSSINSGSEYVFASNNADGSAYVIDASKLSNTAKTSIEGVAVTISNSSITDPSSTAVWTVTGSASKMQLKNGNNYLQINGNGAALTTSSKDVYWNSNTGLYGKSSKGTTSYYAQVNNSNITFSATNGDSTKRFYLYKKNSTSVTIYCTDPNSGEQLVTPTITFAENTRILEVGDVNDTFTATVTGSTSEIVYTSSDESVATVGPSTGRVVAKGVGTTTITASVAAVEGVSKSASASYKLTVTMPALESIAVTTLPTKLIYLEDECFEKGDMVVTATYANKYKEEVFTYTLEPSINVALHTSDTRILVSYTENGITKTTTIPITVTEKPKYTITFNAGSGTCETTSLTEESYQSGIELPSATGIIDEWKFAGWSTESVAEATSDRPGNLYVAGTHYEPTKDITLYAVYSRNESSGGSGDYELVTEALDDWSGDYLIAANDNTFANGKEGGKEGIGAANNIVSPGSKLNGNTIDGDWGDEYHVTLERKAGTTTQYYLKTQDGMYNYRNANANGIDCEYDVDATNGPIYHPIIVTFNNDSTITIASKNSDTKSTYFQYNSNNVMFRFYTSTSQKPIYLYKKQGTIGITTYLSNPTDVALVVPTIAFNETDAKAMLVGDNYTNVATAEGSTGAITYQSSDAKVVTVDENGEVTAVGVGNASITASVAAVLGESKSAQTTYDITVTMPALTSIEVKTNPNKTEYDEGDALSNAGLVLTASYANGYTQEIKEGYVTTPADGAALAAGTNSVDVSYAEGDVTKTTSYKITVTERPKYAVTFMINGKKQTLSQTIANTAISAPEVADVTTTIDGEDVTYEFFGWAEAATEEETNKKPTVLNLTDDAITPTADITLYAVYKRTHGNYAEGFTLNLEYNDKTYYVGAANNSKDRFDSSTTDAITLYYNDGYLWYKNASGTATYCYYTSTTDISFTTTKANATPLWTMTENEGIATFNAGNRQLALNMSNTNIIRMYGTAYPYEWKITYTGEKYALGSTLYYTSYPTPSVTIINVAELIESINNGGSKTKDDVEKMVDKVLGK